MDQIRVALTWVFTFIFYPATVIGLFVFIVAYLVKIVGGGKAYGRFRRLTGALLPIIALIFVILWTDEENAASFKNFFLSICGLGHFIGGAIIGVAFVELGKLIDRVDDEVASSLYALFLSTVGVFMLYSIMQGILGRLHLFLFGMILIGGLDIIFRGPPKVK
jgi:hypothetical protein